MKHASQLAVARDMVETPNTCKTDLDLERERRAMQGKNPFKFLIWKKEEMAQFILYQWMEYAPLNKPQKNGDGVYLSWSLVGFGHTLNNFESIKENIIGQTSARDCYCPKDWTQIEKAFKEANREKNG